MPLTRARCALAIVLAAAEVGCGDEPSGPVGGEGEVVVTVSGAAARSCDLLLEEQGTARVTGADWDELVLGRMSRRTPLVGLAFFRRSDDPFPSKPVTLSVSAVGDGEPVIPHGATCYDRHGRPLEDSNVTLVQAGATNP